MKASLSLQHVSKAYSTNGHSAKIALHDVSVTIQPGEFMMVVGHNGAGKTTLLNVMSGDLKPNSGTVTLESGATCVAIESVSMRRRSGLIGRVFQNPAEGVFRDLRVWENLHVALMNSVPLPFVFGSRRRIEAKFGNELRAAGLSRYLDSLAQTLSGGERQMLALQMAILRRPAVLLLDEHTSGLDAKNARWCMEQTVAWAQKRGMTTVAVTHDLAQALEFGDRLIVLRDGQIAADVAGYEKSALNLLSLAELCGFAGRAKTAL